MLCLLLGFGIVPISVASAAAEDAEATVSEETVNTDAMAVSAVPDLPEAESSEADEAEAASKEAASDAEEVEVISEDTVSEKENADAKAADAFFAEEAETGADAPLDLAGAAGQALSGSISSLPAGTYCLSGDATISNQISLTSGTLDIDLNGHTLTMTNTGSYFMISPNATLNIRDSAGGGTIYNSTYLVWLYNGGTFNLYGGTIDGSKMSGNGPQYGGAVYMYGPMNTDETFNMYGGTIRNCKSYEKGGAVYVGDAKSGHRCVFNMYGGTLENNVSKEGGAIYIGTYEGGTCSVAHLAGKSKISIKSNSASERGSAIYSNGDLELSGVLDIDDIVYLARNNFEGLDSYPSYIKITGHLVIVGDGYIDLDTNYPERGTSNYEPGQALCGNTVVYNADQDEISKEEFYTYSSYFVNTTRNLSVSAGFDPNKNGCTEAAGPANWVTRNTDDEHNQDYIDVMGQTMHVNAVSRPGARQSQDWNYLIYTERGDTSKPMREFYSIKIVKTDPDGNTLDGAVFSLTGTSDEENPSQGGTNISGSSGTSGKDEGVAAGETYFYSSDSNDEKLMIDDGEYTISETTAPNGYTPRQNIATIKIDHEMDGNVSISVVYANESVKLGTTNVKINNNYNDSGVLVNKEIVLTLANTPETPAETDWTLSGNKVGLFKGNENPLGGAEFVLYKDGTDDSSRIGRAVSADGKTAFGAETPAAGTLMFYVNKDGDSGENDISYAEYKAAPSLAAGTYYLKETLSPQGYAAARMIKIEITENGASVQQLSEDGSTYADADGLASMDADHRAIGLKVTDEALVRLPATGKRGYISGFILAMLLMCGCGSLLVLFRRRTFDAHRTRK